MKNVVSLRSCLSYNQPDIDKTIIQVFDDIGDLKLKPKSTVLVKPNLLSKCDPAKCVTTHPSVIEAVSKHLITLGHKVIIADSPAINFKKSSLDSIYKVTGMELAASNSGATLNNNFNSVAVTSANAERLKNTEFMEIVNQVDAIINVAKFKTHSLTGYTGCVKNLYGLIPGLIKAQTHALFPKLIDFSNALIDIEQMVSNKLVLNIIDGVIGMEGPGPMAGKPRVVNKIIASKSAYLADIAMVKIMNMQPANFPVLEEAKRRNIIDGFDLDVVGEDLTKSVIKDYKTVFVTGDVNVLPKWMLGTFRRFFERKVIIPKKECKGCKKCAEHCPMHTIEMVKGKHNDIAKVKYNKCINCFCCQELCPFKIIKITEPFGYKLIRRRQLKRDKKKNSED